jgi:hypothetical protein
MPRERPFPEEAQEGAQPRSERSWWRRLLLGVDGRKGPCHAADLPPRGKNRGEGEDGSDPGEGRFRMMAEASLGGVLLVVGVGALLVGTAALVVGILTLRSARKAAGLAEDRIGYLREEQDRLELLREERRGLAEELEREREEHRGAKEGLERERRGRREAQRRAEQAEQEALRVAAVRLRARLDGLLENLEGQLEDEATSPGGIRRVK